MRRPAADERGFTLPELLIAMTVMLIILSASLATFEVFQSTTTRTARQNDAQEVARATMLRLSRQLRNIAGPVEGLPQSFDVSGPYDLVFKSVNPAGPISAGNPSNVERLRYCLTTGTGQPQRLWRQEQTWTSSTPPPYSGSSTCPDTSWGNPRVVADFVVNNLNGQNRPVFTYNSSDPTRVTEVDTDLYVDPDPLHAPPETHLQSGVFLRNQNRSPVAEFQAAPGTKHVILNASTSSDPEGEALTYAWTDGGSPILKCAAYCDYSTSTGQHSIQLTVTDPGGLSATQSQTVVVQ